MASLLTLPPELINIILQTIYSVKDLAQYAINFWLLYCPPSILIDSAQSLQDL